MIIGFENIAENAKNRIISSNIALPDEIKGCTEEEIRELEVFLDINLPLSYKAFLKVMGHGAGRLMRDSDVFFDVLKKLTKEASEILLYEGTLSLPDKAFVFGMRNGEQFLFFTCDGEEDPEIFYFMDSSSYFEKSYSTFWEFLNDEIRYIELIDIERKKLV